MLASRRSVLAGLSSMLSAWPFSKLAAATNRSAGIYQDLGIRPVINLRGTHTVIGASKVWPDIHDAMAQASRQFVVLDELQDAIGQRLAKLIGCEDAMVTTGAAGAIMVGACACLTGDDAKNVRQLPDLTGMRTEVIIQKVHRNGYDHAVRNTGVKIVEVETREQLANAASDRTAMLYFLGGTTGDWAWKTEPIPLEDCLAIGHKAGFPVMVDAANMLPPWDNLRKLAGLGTDLICISGGKHMRGPQCSGILAGRRDLVRAARLNSNPHSDSMGRPLKAGREEMIGVWLAAEKYAKLDFAALDRQCFEQAEYLARELRKIPRIEAGFAPYEKARRVHRVYASWDEQSLGITAAKCEKQLMEGEPRIAVLRHQPQGILFTLFMNDPGDEKSVARRMKDIFAARRSG